MLDEGVPAETIDAAAKDFGMPMGPIELADMVGLDICWAVGQELAKPRHADPEEAAGEHRGEAPRQEDRQGLLHVGEGQAAEGARHGAAGPSRTGWCSRSWPRRARHSPKGIVEDADLVDAGDLAIRTLSSK